MIFEGGEWGFENRSSEGAFKNFSMHTRGNALPSGNNLQEQLSKWAEAVAANPVPTGNMEVVKLTTAIRASLEARGRLTDALSRKLSALETHLSQGRYCVYLQKNGQIDNCEPPGQLADGIAA